MRLLLYCLIFISTGVCFAQSSGPDIQYGIAPHPRKKSNQTSEKEKEQFGDELGRVLIAELQVGSLYDKESMRNFTELTEEEFKKLGIPAPDFALYYWLKKHHTETKLGWNLQAEAWVELQNLRGYEKTGKIIVREKHIVTSQDLGLFPQSPDDLASWKKCWSQAATQLGHKVANQLNPPSYFWHIISGSLALVGIGIIVGWRYYSITRPKAIPPDSTSPPQIDFYTLPPTTCPITGQQLTQEDWLAGKAVWVKEAFYDRQAISKQPISSPKHNPGDKLGEYLLLAHLGKSRLGDYFLAQRPHCPMRVLHRIPFSIPGNQQRKQRWTTVIIRFQKAQELIAEMKLPEMVNCEELTHGASQKYLFYTMTYYPALSLRTVLRHTGKLKQEAAIKLLQHLATQLHRLHHRGLIHRDIKPGNILCPPIGTPLLTGFFLLKAQQRGNHKIQEITESDFSHELFQEQEEHTGLTRDNTTLGTPAYLSPEQLRDAKNVTPKTDIWAWGVLALELLSGENYFARGTRERCFQVIHHFKDIDEIGSHYLDTIPPAMQKILRKTLTPHLKKRYSAQELVMALEKL